MSDTEKAKFGKSVGRVKKPPTAAQLAKLNRPKRPLKGYMLFMKGFRKHHEGKGWAVPEMGRKGGAAWRAMSDAQKAKY